MIHAARYAAAALLCLSLGCSGGGGGGGSDTGGDDSFGEGSGSTERVQTDCGVVANGELQNPVSLEDAAAVTINRILGTNLVELTVGLEQRVVKLHGIGSSDQPTAIKNYLRGFVGSSAFFVPAGCTAVIRGGSEVSVGQLITAEGVNISEELVKSGLAGMPEANGTCGEALLAACYSALEESGGTARSVSDFLWKPNSESGFNPGGVSILTNPCNVKVVINGTEIRNYGASNGRCVTARAASSGCSYGNNVKVEVIDRETNQPLTFNGAPFITIPNGCNRVEFEGADGVSTLPPPPACRPGDADFRYVPSSPKCGGNIAVELTGSLQDAFSVQLRLPDGSDRLDPACSEVSCTPYKVKNYINEGGTKVACFGAPGTSPVMSEIIQVSVKLSGDDSTPERFCITDPAAPVN